MSVSVRDATMRWLDRVVIGWGLCPFARAPRLRPNALSLRVSEARNTATLLREVDTEIAALQQGPAETSLIVLPPIAPSELSDAHSDFAAFMRIGWDVEERVGKLAPGELQLALFHPAARCSLYDQGDATPADFVQRSPFPTLHFLRCKDIETLAAGPSAALAASLPERNVARMCRKTLSVFSARVSCVAL